MSLPKSNHAGPCGPDGGDCASVTTRLFAYIDYELPQVEVDEVQRHIDGCASCEETLAFERCVQRVLSSRLRSDVEPEAVARLSQAIRDCCCDGFSETGG